MSRKSRRAFNARNISIPSVASPRRLTLSPDARGDLRREPLTFDEVRRAYGPAKTLGAPEDERLAMDSRLADSGAYSLIQHTLELGMGVGPQFMGYGALQNIAQNGLIRACIETVADDMTREWITLKREGEGNSADGLLTELAHAMKRHKLQTLFHEATELVGYEGGAFIFIDTGVSGQELETPLNMSPYSSELRPGGRLRFTVIDPVNVFPGDYNSISPLEPDYFRPRWWWVLGQRVHASRLIRLVANEVPVLLKPAYNFMGIPQAQILWDYVLHFQECRAAEARLLTKFSLTVFKTKMDDVLFAAGGTEQINARIRYMIQSMTNDGVWAVDKETEEVVKLETPLSGVTDIVRQSLEMVPAVNRTPAVKLLGISPSGFNATGESDIRNYYDHVTSQQEKILRDGVKIALDCIQLHSRGEIDPSVTFDFAPLGEEDRAALSAYQKTLADTTAVYLDRQVIAPEEARAMLADDPDSGFASIDPERIFDDEDAPEDNEEYADAPFKADLDDVDKAGAVYDATRDEKIWRTAENGKRFQIDTESGEIVKGNVGQKSWDSEQKRHERRDRVEDAMREIANGRSESTIPHLRNDLEQYGGTNDVTIVRGDATKGLVHIADRHGHAAVAHVLEAVANGEIDRFVPGKRTVHVRRDGYEAVLSLEENGKKKTWLLTGFNLLDAQQKKRLTGDSGKVCTRHASTRTGPILSRPDTGAVSLFEDRILHLMEQVKPTESVDA